MITANETDLARALVRLATFNSTTQHPEPT